jgi:hypothetical protein
MLVDRLTAANDLGLTDAVPAKIAVHIDARMRAIRIGEQTISFKLTAPSCLYWAGCPAMGVVQALHLAGKVEHRSVDQKNIGAEIVDEDQKREAG